jgi:hypothetical protein
MPADQSAGAPGTPSSSATQYGTNAAATTDMSTAGERG